MGLRLFFKNIRFLFRNKLKDCFVNPNDLNIVLDNLLAYELPEHLVPIPRPKIKNFQETIDALANRRVSFARIGDGELALIGGESLPFQSKDPVLADRLREILRSNNDDILIGINHQYYYSDLSNVNDFGKYFARRHVPFVRKIMDKHLAEGKQYYSASVSQAYQIFVDYDFDAYFEKIRRIWKGRDITIICGKTVFGKLDHNVFDNVKSVQYQYEPSKNAFKDYAAILKRAKEIGKDRLIIIILGPTATVLAYDLGQGGYQALDFGHIAKDYDAYMKKQERNPRNIIKFFAPD